MDLGRGRGRLRFGRTLRAAVARTGARTGTPAAAPAAAPGAPFPAFAGEIPRVLPKVHRHTASYYVLPRSTWQNSQGSPIERNLPGF
ncbi:hypothetical protein GCM10009525_11270 [Streptosporangium amethystogenes subsp. fukuiense]